MDAALNVALLLLGLVGALLAFAGETLNKDATSWRRRVTKVGWTSIALLLAAFTVGVIKEVRQYRADQASSLRNEQLDREAREAIAARIRLENDLGRANDQLLGTRRELGGALSELSAAQAKLDALEPALVKAMYKFTERIPRESDYAFISLSRASIRTPISSETRKNLMLYGGDEVEYHTFCRPTSHTISVPDGPFGERRNLDFPLPVVGLSLRAGRRQYPLSETHGTIRIAGPIGEAMAVEILNPNESTCDVKLIVRSADRTRARQQFAEIMGTVRTVTANSPQK